MLPHDRYRAVRTAYSGAGDGTRLVPDPPTSHRIEGKRYMDDPNVGDPIWIGSTANRSRHVDDIINQINQATGCLVCGGSLDDSPSSYFCGELCQSVWHSRFVDDPGVGEPNWVGLMTLAIEAAHSRASAVPSSTIRAYVDTWVALNEEEHHVYAAHVDDIINRIDYTT